MRSESHMEKGGQNSWEEKKNEKLHNKWVQVLWTLVTDINDFVGVGDLGFEQPVR